MNKYKVEGVSVNLDAIAAHESIDTVKALGIFPEGAKGDAAYQAVWEEAQKLKSAPPDVKLDIEKPKKGKKVTG